MAAAADSQVIPSVGRTEGRERMDGSRGMSDTRDLEFHCTAARDGIADTVNSVSLFPDGTADSNGGLKWNSNRESCFRSRPTHENILYRRRGKFVDHAA